ncbi:hypothetical protein ECG_05010 [Echinococcus granulosus]|nr:hypothetical protein ECG_05010 [Echinococcus granulosus]
MLDCVVVSGEFLSEKEAPLWRYRDEDRGDSRGRGSGFYERGSGGAGFLDRGGRGGGFQGSRVSPYNEEDLINLWPVLYFRERSMSQNRGDVDVADQQLTTTPPAVTGVWRTTPGPRGSNRPQAASSSKTREKRRFPSRPGRGTAGKRVSVEVNCWDFDVSDVSVLQYTITPTKLLNAEGKVLINEEKGLWKFVKDAMKGIRGDVFYDGGQHLYSLEPLEGEEGGQATCSAKVSRHPQNDDLTIEYTVRRAHRAFFPAGNLADILHAKYGSVLHSKPTWKHVKEEIKSLYVEAGHYRNKALDCGSNFNAVSGKTYRKRLVVHGLSDNTADREMISDRNQSVAEYFKERYGIDLKYPELPCVKVSVHGCAEVNCFYCDVNTHALCHDI